MQQLTGSDKRHSIWMTVFDCGMAFGWHRAGRGLHSCKLLHSN